MKEWLAPQISEHCPKNKPHTGKEEKTIFIRPGLASAFIPKQGIVHLWRTSEELIKNRHTELTGKTKWLSVWRRRKSPLFKSEKGVIYLSNSTPKKSE
jgi:hypothetical protein